jgi:hypothetical protein
MLRKLQNEIIRIAKDDMTCVVHESIFGEWADRPLFKFSVESKAADGAVFRYCLTGNMRSDDAIAVAGLLPPANVDLHRLRASIYSKDLFRGVSMPGPDDYPWEHIWFISPSAVPEGGKFDKDAYYWIDNMTPGGTMTHNPRSGDDCDASLEARLRQMRKMPFTGSPPNKAYLEKYSYALEYPQETIIRESDFSIQLGHSVCFVKARPGRDKYDPAHHILSVMDLNSMYRIQAYFEDEIALRQFSAKLPKPTKAFHDAFFMLAFAKREFHCDDENEYGQRTQMVPFIYADSRINLANASNSVRPSDAFTVHAADGFVPFEASKKEKTFDRVVRYPRDFDSKSGADIFRPRL